MNKGEHYLIRWNDPATLGGVPFGVLLDLEKHGFHVGVDAASAAGALPHRVLPEASANQVLWVVLGETNIDLMRARADATELGYFDQRTPDEVTRSDALREHLIDRLIELDLACLVPKIDEQYGLASFFLGSLDRTERCRQDRRRLQRLRPAGRGLRHAAVRAADRRSQRLVLTTSLSRDGQITSSHGACPVRDRQRHMRKEQPQTPSHSHTGGGPGLRRW